MHIDALILDLGNVLVFHDNAKLFRELASEFRTTPEDLEARLADGLWERVNRGHLPGDLLRQELVARLGVDLSPTRWFDVWNCHFAVNEPMVKAVEQLVGRLPLALLSNTHDQHVAYLRPRLPVLERFQALVLSCEVGMIKPEPGVYRHALTALGTSPERTAFFDDVERYVAAATAEGLRGRVFTTVANFAGELRACGVPI